MIRITNLSRRAGNRTILDSVNLEIRRGEIFTLIGPSGSGKTTLLRLLDLLDKPTGGSIVLDGVATDGSKAAELAARRKMAMVFQKPTVLNTTVAQNIAVGLRFRGERGSGISDQVQSVLDLVGLSGFADRKAVTLSGGEMQRIAIARAIITKPEVLLLDEPTANLDPENAAMIEDLILQINKTFDTTIVLSTHDMIQGQRLAHRIGVIMDGRLVQAGEIPDIFFHPVNRTVASFVGIEPIRGGIVERNEEGLGTIKAGNLRIQAVTNKPQGSKVTLCIRPEDVTLNKPDEPCPSGSARNCLQGTVTRLIPLGPFTRVYLDCDGIVVAALVTRKSEEELGIEKGSRLAAHIKATAIHVIPDK
ncbi:MAG: Trehalose/maltose import ATP-binding protein MalK [Methanoregula sp. PtaU1.Bin051]|nr:MAG: Trehalose/maltose import ATP-binding protein MalK [Methanoregula sp. PtaU1.Bin051]